MRVRAAPRKPDRAVGREAIDLYVNQFPRPSSSRTHIFGTNETPAPIWTSLLIVSSDDISIEIFSGAQEPGPSHA